MSFIHAAVPALSTCWTVLGLAGDGLGLVEDVLGLAGDVLGLVEDGGGGIENVMNCWE